MGCRARGLSPLSAPQLLQAQGTVQGDGAGAFCQLASTSHSRALEELGGCLHTRLRKLLQAQRGALTANPSGPSQPLSILLRTLCEAPAITQVMLSCGGGDTGDYAGPGAGEKTRARWCLPQRWPSQELRTATSSTPEGRGRRLLPLSNQRCTCCREVRCSTLGLLWFGCSNKVLGEVEPNSSSSPNSIPKRTIALKEMSQLVLQSKTPGPSVMPELVPVSPRVSSRDATSIGATSARTCSV